MPASSDQGPDLPCEVGAGGGSGSVEGGRRREQGLSAGLWGRHFLGAQDRASGGGTSRAARERQASGQEREGQPTPRRGLQPGPATRTEGQEERRGEGRTLDSGP
ncbi:hypothetical protein [Deinococcus hopiensis]|uniref:hypothetical protein n=1 Tax=Deinococcus hopiensis TaxID=309885 RepID=UPI00111C2E4E|nr:hypothetical protein [Deinococcus hopiensis]